MRAFISHISEESPVATCLKDWIESTVLGQCDVFVSSDSATLPGGVKWLNEIDSALQAANVFLVVCSAASLPRPWVNFETGCAWSRGIPIIPLCHSGVSKGTLPRPISEFQAIDLADPKFAQLLLESLQAHFKLARLPRINNAEMQTEVAAALASIGSVAKPTAGPTKPPSATVDLRDECLKILHFLGQQSSTLSAQQIAGHFHWSEQQARFFVDELTNENLIRTALNTRTGASYALNELGRKYLFERGML